jgi:ferredoxin--NADP+ reductase
MAQVGSESNPLRVAVIGAGPAGFYTAENILKRKDIVAQVDLFERLPTPYGLVRYGVAPDHQEIKAVTRVYDRTASKPEFRFFGNVDLGKHIHVEDLRRHYHQIVYCTGAQTDRRLGVPGEDLKGSLPATEFVAWYNGHPDYRNYKVDLAHENVAVVGIGNVALDVARILCRTPEELAVTDINDDAMKVLGKSGVKNVYVLGRRGPVQAAFTTPEIKELGEMADTDAIVLPDEAELDPLSKTALAESNDRATTSKVEAIQSYAGRERTGKSRTLTVRFLVSPVELIGDEAEQVTKIRLVKNRLHAAEDGSLRPKPTGEYEELPVGLVFRSVGYRGVPLPDVPFHEKWGIILNRDGRVTDGKTEQPVMGEYAAGWIKRGPSGVIGTNKACAVGTVAHMLEDLSGGTILRPDHPSAEAAEHMVRERQPEFFSYDDWRRIDEVEVANGNKRGRARVKFTDVHEMLAVLGR